MAKKGRGSRQRSQLEEDPVSLWVNVTASNKEAKIAEMREKGYFVWEEREQGPGMFLIKFLKND